ncbi:MAG: site-specific integrase [Oscillospiraceae bacterium]|nr:site-specific integrase [Oscillospiraceae bacterium]
MPKMKKTTRRGNKEGTVFQRKDGRWVGEVTIGYGADGKRISKLVYGKSQDEVIRKMNPLKQEVFDNGYIKEVVQITTERNFQTLFTEWFNTYKAPTIKSSATEENHRIKMRLHIFPAFGKLDIHSVTSERIQKFLNNKVKNKELSVDQVNRIRQLMNNFYSSKMIKKIVEENPMDEVVVAVCRDEGAEEHTKLKALRPEIRTKVFNLVMENNILKPIIITSAFTGVRPQELIALEWDNLNIEQQSIKVGKVVKRTVKFDDCGNVIERGNIIGVTKTKRSERVFNMPMIVIEALQEWRLYCEENGIVSKYVFPNTQNSERRKYAGLQSLLRRFIEKHNLESEDISLYTFRHTFATILLEQGVHPKVVSEMMGHANTKMVMDVYSHIVSQDVFKQSAKTLDKAYSELGLAV